MRDGGSECSSIPRPARPFLAGEIPRLQSSSNLTRATLPNLPAIAANGAFFSLPTPTNRSSFYRAVVTPP
jgi:hypothetical protein